MESVQTADDGAIVRATNVGGIDSAEVELAPGVTVLTGRNASNRTSFLQAIMAALGSDDVSLNAHAEAGQVELDIGDETYTRTLERVDGDVVFGGDPYADDPTLADLFAFLLELNEARRGVTTGEDLRELIMRPVDTSAIREEIETLETRKRDLEQALGEREPLNGKRDSLERTRIELENQLEEKREALATKQDAIEAASAELEDTQERKAELETKLSELQDYRSRHENVRFRLQTERASVDEFRAELAEVETALENNDEPSGAEIETLEEQRESLRERKRVLDSKLNQLQSLIQFNEDMLDGDEIDGVVRDDAVDADDPTSQLLHKEEHRCWTCGEKTTRTQIETTLEELRDRRSDLLERRREVTTELEEISSRRNEHAERQRRYSELEQRREDLKSELSGAEETIDSLETELAAIETDIDRAESEVEDLREEAYDEIIELHKDANALEVEIEQLDVEFEETEQALESTQNRLQELDALEKESEEVAEQLQAARHRIERLEDEAVSTFNDQMDEVLDVLEYDNVERIWIERTEQSVTEGRRQVNRGVFALHVVRSSAAETVYEDTVDHLSESEREVVGLVFALAGYLVHDVHQTMPFMLLDSIEAIDSNRIAALIDYLSDYAPYLVVALLPEDAAAVPDGYHEVTTI